MITSTEKEAYRPFTLDEYVDNPVALVRIKARLSQEELAQRMGVDQLLVLRQEIESLASKMLVMLSYRQISCANLPQN